MGCGYALRTTGPVVLGMPGPSSGRHGLGLLVVLVLADHRFVEEGRFRPLRRLWQGNVVLVRQPAAIAAIAVEPLWASAIRAGAGGSRLACGLGVLGCGVFGGRHPRLRPDAPEFGPAQPHVVADRACLHLGVGPWPSLPVREVAN